MTSWKNKHLGQDGANQNAVLPFLWGIIYGISPLNTGGLIRTIIVTTEYACLAIALVSSLFTDGKNRVREWITDTLSLICTHIFILPCVYGLFMNYGYFGDSSDDSDVRCLYQRRKEKNNTERLMREFSILDCLKVV